MHKHQQNLRGKQPILLGPPVLHHCACRFIFWYTSGSLLTWLFWHWRKIKYLCLEHFPSPEWLWPPTHPSPNYFLKNNNDRQLQLLDMWITIYSPCSGKKKEKSRFCIGWGGLGEWVGFIQVNQCSIIDCGSHLVNGWPSWQIILEEHPNRISTFQIYRPAPNRGYLPLWDDHNKDPLLQNDRFN